MMRAPASKANFSISVLHRCVYVCKFCPASREQRFRSRPSVEVDGKKSSTNQGMDLIACDAPAVIHFAERDRPALAQTYRYVLKKLAIWERCQSIFIYTADDLICLLYTSDAADEEDSVD